MLIKRIKVKEHNETKIMTRDERKLLGCNKYDRIVYVIVSLTVNKPLHMKYYAYHHGNDSEIKHFAKCTK